MMKPPVKLDALMEEWTKDAKLDLTEPAIETSKIPILHAKYLHILTHHKLIVKKISADYNEKKLFKSQYFKGEFNNADDLEKYDLEPFRKNAGIDIETYLDGDKELIDILLRRAIHEEIVSFCNAVLKELNQRSYQTSSIIKWQMFTRGSG